MQNKAMGFGTFDGLHPGHLNYLKQLGALGNETFLVVARDKNVKKIKGRMPRLNENKRIDDLKKTKLINNVLLGDKDDFYKCIKDSNPDIIGLGYDQQANLDEIKKLFPDIRIIRLKAFEPEKHKSSILNNPLSSRT